MEALFLIALNVGFVVIVTGVYSMPEDKDPPFIIKLIGIRFLGTLFCKRCKKKKVDPNLGSAIQVDNQTDQEEKKIIENGSKEEKVNISDADSTESKEDESWQQFARNLNIVFSIIYAVGFIIIVTIFVVQMIIWCFKNTV